MVMWKVEVSGRGMTEARAVLERSGFEMSSEPPEGTLPSEKVRLTACVEAEDGAGARQRIEEALAEVDNVSVGQAARV